MFGGSGVLVAVCWGRVKRACGADRVAGGAPVAVAVPLVAEPLPVPVNEPVAERSVRVRAEAEATLGLVALGELPAGSDEKAERVLEVIRPQPAPCSPQMLVENARAEALHIADVVQLEYLREQ